MSESASKERPFSGPTFIVLGNIQPRRISDGSHKKFICKECGKIYTTSKTLRCHIKKFHPSKLFKLAPPVKSLKTYKYKCSHCERQFNQFRNLKFHKRKVHNDVESPAPMKTHKCPLCDNHFGRKYFSDHLQEAHELNIETEEIEFATFEDFNLWKENIEKQTRYKYVKNSGTKMNSKSKCHYFSCHRSGNFVSESKGVRKVKSKGSNKIGAFCPASMNVFEDESGKCSVVFTKTHVGHQNDLGHLVLTKSERQTLATKIASKLPFDVILEDVRNSTSESGLERLHLLTKQDLYNVTNSFNLSSVAVRHEDEGNDRTDDLIMPSQETSESVTSSMSLNEKRENVTRTCIDFINSLSTGEEMDAFQEHVIAAKPIISALRSGIGKSSIPPMSLDNMPANKIVKPKRRSFSMKKGRKNTKNSGIELTVEEEQNIAEFMILNRENESL